MIKFCIESWTVFLGRIQPSGFHIENEDFPALPSRSTAEWKRSEGHVWVFFLK